MPRVTELIAMTLTAEPALWGCVLPQVVAPQYFSSAKARYVQPAAVLRAGFPEVPNPHFTDGKDVTKDRGVEESG